jgi:phosphatidylinositol kinase/protein kinase (PI-3  family)
LKRRKESRQRNIAFHLPVIVTLAPQIRLVQDDASNVTLMEIFENHCRNTGMKKDQPVTHHINRLREYFIAQETADVCGILILESRPFEREVGDIPRNC